MLDVGFENFNGILERFPHGNEKHLPPSLPLQPNQRDATPEPNPSNAIFSPIAQDRMPPPPRQPLSTFPPLPPSPPPPSLPTLTWRRPQQQQQATAAGVSWTPRVLHESGRARPLKIIRIIKRNLQPKGNPESGEQGSIDTWYNCRRPDQRPLLPLATWAEAHWKSSLTGPCLTKLLPRGTPRLWLPLSPPSSVGSSPFLPVQRRYSANPRTPPCTPRLQTASGELSGGRARNKNMLVAAMAVIELPALAAREVLTWRRFPTASGCMWSWRGETCEPPRPRRRQGESKIPAHQRRPSAIYLPYRII